MPVHILQSGVSLALVWSPKTGRCSELDSYWGVGDGPAPSQDWGVGVAQTQGERHRCGQEMVPLSVPGHFLSTNPSRPESAPRARIAVLCNPLPGLATLERERTYIRGLYTVTAY